MATVEMSAALKRQIEALRKPFHAFAHDFGKLAETRAELAPKFMSAYGTYLQQTGGSFVDFCRLIDPSIPAERSAYRAHKSYQAADYLRRLVARRDVGARRTRPVRSNVTVLARALGSLLPLVKDQDQFWSGVAAEFGLTQRQVGRLRTVTGEVKPLLDLRGVKPTQTRIVHVPTEAEAKAA